MGVGRRFWLGGGGLPFFEGWASLMLLESGAGEGGLLGVRVGFGEWLMFCGHGIRDRLCRCEHATIPLVLFALHSRVRVFGRGSSAALTPVMSNMIVVIWLFKYRENSRCSDVESLPKCNADVVNSRADQQRIIFLYICHLGSTGSHVL